MVTQRVSLFDRYLLIHSQTLTESSRIPFNTNLSTILEAPFKANPLEPSASRYFRFCVPDEWYRRSRSRSSSTASFEPSEDTVKRLASLQESEEEGEDEGADSGTAKLGQSSSAGASSSIKPFIPPNDWRSSLSQNRLSSMFESWIRPTSPVAGLSSPERKTVSEPKPMTKLASSSSGTTTVSDLEGVEYTEFEQMLVCTLALRTCSQNTNVTVG